MDFTFDIAMTFHPPPPPFSASIYHGEVNNKPGR